MLTEVPSGLQPKLADSLLTSVYVTTLKQRLIESMGDRFKPVDLARECGISRAAVAKWFSEATKRIDAVHIFKLARVLQVDAEWLATGEGRKDRGIAQVRADMKEIPESRLDLIRRYGTLPKEIRFSIRMLIQTLAVAGSEKYASWSKEIEQFNEIRDAKPRIKPKAKKTITE